MTESGSLIIFDTNAVNRLNPTSDRADIIRKLRKSGKHRVAVPWMVLEELVAHQAKIYLSRHQKAEKAITELQAATAWKLDAHVEELALKRLQDHWRTQYSEIFEVIETSGDAARMALAREAMALPPAKQNERAEGGRDVAIWFSILEYLRANPDEHACFVTDNHHDFGNGTDYPFPMNEDLRGMEIRLSRLKDFDAVVRTFTKAVSGETALATAEALLSSIEIRDEIAQAALGMESPHPFIGIDSTSAPVQWSTWLLAPDVELLSVSAVEGHEIGHDVWYTAKAEWLLFGPTFTGERSLIDRVACTWATKILFSANSEKREPTLLSSGVPSLPDLEDKRCATTLARMKDSLRQKWTKVSDQLTSNWAWSPEYIDALRKIAAQSAMRNLDLSSLAPKIDYSSLYRTLRDTMESNRPTYRLPKYDIEGHAHEDAGDTAPSDKDETAGPESERDSGNERDEQS
ncbi:PIN domain-containing protein [Actinacidiphila sp. DG2A-62]|uniref:PIN domain-containing protein n=1 Tax=Actinacidiphila sp. DG2A-62 TaxID=3108821 RepID=UPI002DB8CBFB|nr:PIN domain-containing protein [Actinacidiphila sp. DG2A-62]MEC3998872.1 PIN domain-containing protein [Actinacidiphila sp. DG2A-62]